MLQYDAADKTCACGKNPSCACEPAPVIPDDLSRLPTGSQFRSLGRFMHLVSTLHGYRKWSFEKVERLIMPCIQKGYELFSDDGTSAALWYPFSRDDLEYYLTHDGNVRLQDVIEGDHIIITHFISLGGYAPRFMRQTLDKICQRHPASNYVYGLRGFKNNKVCRLPVRRMEYARSI